MEPDPNTLAEEAYQEVDGLMALLQERGQIDFLTGTQLYFLLQPIKENLDEIRTLTQGPSPSVGAAAVVSFPQRR